MHMKRAEVFDGPAKGPVASVAARKHRLEQRNRAMNTSSRQPGPTSRERIDALLDEALMESFPASDSSAIGSGMAAIKEERRFDWRRRRSIGG